MALPGVGDGEDGPGATGGGGSHISPREGLIVAFRTAVETIERQLLQAIFLGMLIAAFTVTGVDKRRMDPERTAYASNFMRSRA